MTADEAYRTQPIRPKNACAIIEGMDGLVVRQWNESDDDDRWCDTWYSVENSTCVLPVGYVARGTADGVQVSLSPGDLINSLRITNGQFSNDGIWNADAVLDIFEQCGITWQGRVRRPYRRTDTLSATVLQTLLQVDNVEHSPTAWHAVFGLNHLPMILARVRPVAFVEPRMMRRWRMRINSNSATEVSLVHCYRDVSQLPECSSCTDIISRRRNVLDLLFNNGSPTIIPLCIDEAMAAKQHDMDCVRDLQAVKKSLPSAIAA